MLFYISLRSGCKSICWRNVRNNSEEFKNKFVGLKICVISAFLNLVLFENSKDPHKTKFQIAVSLTEMLFKNCIKVSDTENCSYLLIFKLPHGKNWLHIRSKMYLSSNLTLQTHGTFSSIQSSSDCKLNE